MELMIFGTLMIAGGFASVIYGNYLNNDLSTQISSYFSGANPGTTWMIFGAVAIVLGIILVVNGNSNTKFDKRIDQELGGTHISDTQRKFLRAYLEQLDDGVITMEQYKVLKYKLLNPERPNT